MEKLKKLLWIMLKIFVGVLIAGGLIVFLLMLSGPLISRYVSCTQPTCIGNGFSVDFVGATAPKSYIIEVEFPEGKRRVVCDRTSLTPPSSTVESQFCRPNGAFFEKIGLYQSQPLPATVVVTVIFDGQKITRTIRPKYDVPFATSKRCIPQCANATIEFNLSEK